MTSPPEKTWATTEAGIHEILAIRVESESGATEFLLATHNTQPEWVPAAEVQGANTASRA